jgi:elongation factor P
MRLRVRSSGRRSAWRAGLHHGVDWGDAGFIWKFRFGSVTGAGETPVAGDRPPDITRTRPLKVIASSLRKGNVVEMEGRLYVVLTASNFHPGKGTPTTSVDMRRISDGTKVSERWRTTEMVEKATVDEREYDFLYEDGEGFHFMEPTTYEQVVVTEDILGANKAYLQEGMRCYVKTFDGVPIAMEVPQKITVEILETEPVTKGQTASSSYKPAVVQNGLRVMVPPHIGPGVRIVINTDDDSYVERAKD